MNFVRKTGWPEVFGGWSERESKNLGWVDCATRIKGWPDWESWRLFTAEQIRAKEREWQIYKSDDPINEIPQILVGPYTGWQAKVPRKNDTTFAELLKIPENYQHFSQHDGVLNILNGLPFSTELIGVVRSDGRIVCIDGHHRAAAITLAKIMDREIDFSETYVTIALSNLKADEENLLNAMLERGTERFPKQIKI